MRIIIIIIIFRLGAENKYENYNHYYYQVGGRESLDVRDQRDVGGHAICRACLPGPVILKSFFLKPEFTRSLLRSLFSEAQVYEVFVGLCFIFSCRT